MKVAIMGKLQLNCALNAQHESELQGAFVSFTLFLCYFSFSPFFFPLLLRPILTFMNTYIIIRANLYVMR